MLRFVNALTFSILILTNCFGIYQGYGYYKVTDTERGFCEGPGFGRILVGSTGYDDIKCEVISCGEGLMTLAGCPSPGNYRNDCTLERGKGHYPACCFQLKCKGFD